jgi:hypothetical protein
LRTLIVARQTLVLRRNDELWLLAAGGTLYFAYPQLYVSAFSGFTFP